MIHSILLKNKISVVVILFLASCTSNTQENKNETKSSDTLKMGQAVQDTPSNKCLLEGHLDTLYIETANFKKLKGGRMVLKPYINNMGELTLHGWQHDKDNDNGKYEPANPLKNIELKTGNTSGVTFGKGSFLGNVILSKNAVSNIKDAMDSSKNNTMKYVVFYPENITDYPGNFLYNIMLTDYEPVAGNNLIVKSQVSVNAVANPSPPRNPH